MIVVVVVVVVVCWFAPLSPICMVSVHRMKLVITASRTYTTGTFDYLL
jgi:hypothetical protein